MGKVNKWLYLFVVQGCYRYKGEWEDVTQAETWREARGYLKDYNQNEPNIPHRMIKRREPNPEYKAG